MKMARYLYLLYLGIVSIFYLLAILTDFYSSANPIVTIAPGGVLVIWDIVEVFWSRKFYRLLTFPFGSQLIFFSLFFADWPKIYLFAIIPFAISCILPIPNLLVMIMQRKLEDS
jgi:hypothetical protein